MDLFDIIDIKNKNNIRFLVHFPEQAKIFLHSILQETLLKIDQTQLHISDLHSIDFKSIIGMSIHNKEQLTIYYKNKNFDDFYLNDYKDVSVFSNIQEVIYD